MFRGIILYFTDRPYYEQWKRYMKRQRAFRKAMKRQAKDFCPWSGWYMNEMIKLMLKFYTETYEAGDCCWSEDERRLERARTMRQALDYAEQLERIEDMEDHELIALAKKDRIAFVNYVKAWETETSVSIEESSKPETLMAALADEYLTEKYTKALHKVIGENIWEWCD